MNELYSYLGNHFNQKIKKIDEKIAASTKSDLNSINSSIKNIFSGKKIRAILSLISFMLCDENHDEETAINTASAIELIHNATLLHDDVVDNSNIRRGKKNLKSIFGNKTSVLTGDFFLSVAFKLIITTGNIHAVGLLSDTALKLSEGELKQLDLSGKIITENEYLEIISTKTAILFSAGCEIASILTGKTIYQSTLKSFGYNLGMAFQIVDDILDYTGKEKFGKEIGNDFFNSKFTLPCIVAYEKSSSLQEKNFWEETFFQEEKNLEEIIYYIKKSNAIELSMNKAKKYITNAETNLSIFESNKYKIFLKEIMNFVLNRCY
jgi:octaprenyl-diphosphate synthase